MRGRRCETGRGGKAIKCVFISGSLVWATEGGSVFLGIPRGAKKLNPNSTPHWLVVSLEALTLRTVPSQVMRTLGQRH